jgi:hypothetical protein
VGGQYSSVSPPFGLFSKHRSQSCFLVLPVACLLIFRRGLPLRETVGNHIITSLLRNHNKLSIMSREFQASIARVGLEQYLSCFTRAGYSDWHSLCNITEAHFVELRVKLGHRRKLQREIAKRHGWPASEPLPTHGRQLHRACSSRCQRVLISKL